MKKFQIIDLDGCIADDIWRRPYIRDLAPGEAPNAERFEEYHKASFLDKPRNLNFILPDAEVVILTARPVKWREQTELWLANAGVTICFMIMRNNSDHRPSVELKEAQVRWLPIHYDVPLHRIVQALDDRPDIVAMYKEKFNLPARVVCIGEECSL